MKLRTLWIAASFSLLTACAGAVTVDVPDLIDYSAEFQKRAAIEKKNLNPPCHRQTPSADCSPVRTLVEDYFWMRERIREAE